MAPGSAVVTNSMRQTLAQCSPSLAAAMLAMKRLMPGELRKGLSPLDWDGVYRRKLLKAIIRASAVVRKGGKITLPAVPPPRS